MESTEPKQPTEEAKTEEKDNWNAEVKAQFYEYIEKTYGNVTKDQVIEDDGKLNFKFFLDINTIALYWNR